MGLKVPKPFIFGYAAVAAYWVALAAGVRTPLVTHWGFIALLAAPAALIVLRGVTHSDHRVAWPALGTGLLCSAFGWVLQPADAATPAPGAADAAWLALYPGALIAFAGLARPWVRRAPRTVALDAATIMPATAALATAVALPVALANAGNLSGIAQLVSFAYPTFDCILVTVALIGAAVVGWRGGPSWTLLASAIVALAIGDTLWATQAASGTWAVVMGSNAIYPLVHWLAATAVFVGRPPRLVTLGVVRTHAAALIAAVAALILLVANEWIVVPGFSVVLAGLTLLCAIHRSALALARGVRASLAAARERELVDEVRGALAEGELHLHFQPLVDARTGAVKGAEALLRWTRDGVDVAPDEFLPAVECSELMAPLTDWVLDTALAEAAGWNGLSVSVNLATANLAEPDLPARVLGALRRHHIPPGRLTLEITETAAVEDSVIADAVLGELDDIGVALSVDDFGTGHSSIVRLARFPISEVKIDRLFVREMHTSQRPIVATTIELAHSLGLRVVAEGIEDRGTLLALRELGCDIAQGYHLSRPLTATGFAAWLAAHDSRAADLGVVDLGGDRKRPDAVSDVPAPPEVDAPDLPEVALREPEVAARVDGQPVR